MIKYAVVWLSFWCSTRFTRKKCLSQLGEMCRLHSYIFGNVILGQPLNWKRPQKNMGAQKKRKKNRVDFIRTFLTQQFMDSPLVTVSTEGRAEHQ